MSIYDMIGGEKAVAEAVDKFYTRLTADPELAAFFERADVGELKARQRMFMTAALGGPDAYEGRDMRAAHAHLKITDADFDVFLDCLAQTLTELEFTPERITDVLESLAPLRLEIVSAAAEGPDDWGSLDRTGGSG